MALAGALACALLLNGAAERDHAGSWGPAQQVLPLPLEGFLSSLGVCTHIDQGYPAQSYVGPLRYLGVRLVRDGYRHTDALIAVARATGTRLDLIASGDQDKLLEAARAAQRAGVLAAIEGPNEPNNFGMVWQGRPGGRKDGWLPVALYQAELYRRVKADPLLAAVPVYGVSEAGAETENVGLQFARIPPGARTLMPDGTRFSDFLNDHNYVSAVHGGYGPDQAWQAADPVLRGRWDGLAGNHGITWYRHFPGYAPADLPNIPRVTTETGYDAGSDQTSQKIQGAALINAYLAQFARGWSATFIYELRDMEGGVSTQGLYAGATPKLAAQYIHNLTTILTGPAPVPPAAPVAPAAPIAIASTAKTVHAVLLAGPDGRRFLVIWNETDGAEANVRVMAGQPFAPRLFDVTRGSDAQATLPAARVQTLVLGMNEVILSW